MVSVADFAITHVVPGVFYRGATPETPLADGSHSGFRVAVKLFVHALRPGAATVKASGGWGASNSSKVALGAGENVVAVDLIAAADQISLWWPNGAGKQPLYNLSASVAADGGALAPVTAQRRIGFRTFAIFTGDGIDSLFFFCTGNSRFCRKRGFVLHRNAPLPPPAARLCLRDAHQRHELPSEWRKRVREGGKHGPHGGARKTHTCLTLSLRS